MKSIEIADRQEKPQLPSPPPQKPKNLIVELAKDFLVGALALTAWSVLRGGRREDDPRFR